ncbi:MAG: class B sortase [Oscillospiraceae bacterium]|nr:class B sortase [Oscillospiraceae bacterium]
MNFIIFKFDRILANIRKITAFTLAAAFCISLTACKKSEPEPAPPPEATRFELETDAPETEPPVTEPPKMLPDYLEWWEKNNDVVGWIRLGDTRINYPIMQGNDNDYYMLHDFDGNVDLYESCITADYRVKFNRLETSDNILIYGHNSAKNTYFAALSNYYRSTVDGTLSYYKKYPVVNIDTMYEKAEWKIFACVLMNTKEKYGEVFRYWDYIGFKNEDKFYDYILKIMDRSVLFTDVDIEYGDKIATLSTCLYPYGEDVDSRCVVFARKVREGESAEVDLEKAKHNTGVLRFKYESQVIGDSWNGRVWNTKKYLKGYKETSANTNR